ncbi:type IV pilus assembly protein [Acidithiobacillus sp. GGI-221]|nr:type IV pilus assembly protein [Acidithiobacillus sp. GGI-221]
MAALPSTWRGRRHREGVLTMRQNGLKRIREGVTSLEEVLRVTNL